MADQEIREVDIIAEVFLIWESESRYVIDTLESWMSALEKPCIRVNIFLRKDTPDKEKPKEKPWIRIHQTRTATHSASRTNLVAYILENYNSKGNTINTLPKENIFNRPKVRFQKPLYIVEEFEDQYEELMSLLRGSERFGPSYSVEVINRTAIQNSRFLQTLDDLRQNNLQKQSDKGCVLCSVDMGSPRSGRNSRRESYYACGHEMIGVNGNGPALDVSNQNNSRSILEENEYDNFNLFSMAQKRRQSRKPFQDEELCQYCSARRNSLFVPQDGLRQMGCTCGQSSPSGHKYHEGRSGRRSASPVFLCEGCRGNRRSTLANTNNNDNELFCGNCMSVLMRLSELNRSQSKNENLFQDNQHEVLEELCPSCSDNAKQEENSQSSPTMDSKNESGAESPDTSQNGSLSESLDVSPSTSIDIEKEETELENNNNSPRSVSVYPRGPLKYYCQFCPQKTFQSQMILDVHIRNCHKKCNCGCNQLFQNRNEYIKHFYKVYPLGCLVVRKCPERFRSLFYQALHHKEEHYSEKPFYCIPCHREYASDIGKGKRLCFKDLKSLRMHGEIIGHTDEEMFLLTRDVENREQNQPKLTLRSSVINFSG